MKTPLWILSTLISFALVASGCGHAKPKNDDLSVNTAIDDSNFGSSDQGKGMGLRTVHFLYDSNLLNSEAKSVLEENAKILKTHLKVKVQIEGHCDNRGGAQYNLALGEKRAASALKYLKDLGVSVDQLSTISYGKERPLDPSETEEAYAKNRRDNFVVIQK